MTTSPCCWLSFTIPQVQAFVGAARTVRDLRVGSALLSYLTGEAIIAGLDHGGTLLFPQVGKADIMDARQSGALSIPNRFLMELPPGVDPAVAAKDCRTAANEAWLKLCGRVHDMLAGKLSGQAGWDAGWDEQVKQFWDIRVHTVCPSDDDETAYQTLYGRPSAGQWRRQWGLITAAERMAKHMRHYPGDGGQGRPKCSMMGELEQMGPMGSPREAGQPAGWGEQAAFWAEALRRFRQDGLRLGKHDRLCAVSLVKRFAPTQVMQDLQQPVRDTARVAAKGWLAECRQQGLGTAVDEFEERAKALAKALGSEGETVGRYLLDDQPTEEEKAAAEEPAMTQARRALLDGARKKGLGRPPRYFAVLMLDGDHIGRWLGGDEQPDKELTKDHFVDVGRKLRSFAQAAPKVIERHHGYPVYTGGDDLLALLPMREALPCAQALQKAFFDETRHSASMGLVICHYMHDLRDALQRTRLAVDDAKDAGRNALAWRLLRRSGEETAGVADWALLEKAAALQALYLAGASDRWSYRLAENRPAIAESGDPAPLRPLIAAFMQRSEGKLHQETQKAATALWDQHNTFAAHPRRAEVGLQWAGGRLFGAYLDLLSLCAFLARGGE